MARLPSGPGGCRGVLTGLVFVAASINLQEIVSEPGSGLPGRAAEALILLVGVLTASVLLLVPGQGRVTVGAEVLAVGLATWGWVVAIQLLSREGRLEPVGPPQLSPTQLDIAQVGPSKARYGVIFEDQAR